MSKQPQPVNPVYRAGSYLSGLSSFRRTMALLPLVMLLVAGLIFLGIGVFGLLAVIIEGFEAINAIIMLVVAAMSLMLLYAVWQSMLGYTAEYRFHDAGLEVRYLLHQPKLIPWEQFQAVGIYFANNDPRNLDKSLPILCCVMKGEKLNLYGHWKLSPFHIKRVIQIPYTPGLYAGLQEKCTIPVTDLRSRYWARFNAEDD